MTDRLSLRDKIPTKELANSTPEERFQSLTLRPVLKLQNELILGLFANYIKESKSPFHTFSKEKKVLFVENSLQKNTVLKNKLLGICIAMFSLEEFTVYSVQTSLYNKRIMALMVERIRSQIELISPQSKQ
jgi:hypothetical protein